MSEILVNKLTGTSTAGDITITNGTTTQKLQDGVVSTYSLYDQQNNAVDMSINVSSVTDSATGRYGLNLSNNYTTAKQYIIGHSAQSWFSNAGADTSPLYSVSTASVLEFIHVEGGTVRDTQYNADSVIGDLA